MHDPYLELIKEQWPSISDTYNRYAEQAADHAGGCAGVSYPRLPGRRVHHAAGCAIAAPGRDANTTAVANRQMVLFVRDTDNKVFQSYTLALED